MKIINLKNVDDVQNFQHWMKHGNMIKNNIEQKKLKLK
jgi:hypothetical protein